MKPELDKALTSLVTVLGDRYKTEKRAGTEDVYWEFEDVENSNDVLFSIMYDASKNAMQFEVEGSTLEKTSKFCKSAVDLLLTIRQWARSQHADKGVEATLLAKLCRLAAQL